MRPLLPFLLFCAALVVTACSQLPGQLAPVDDGGSGGLKFETGALKQAYADHEYSVTIKVTGVSGSYIWIISGEDELPEGLLLIASEDGMRADITGTPTSLGRYPFGIDIFDIATGVVVVSRNFRIDVVEYPGLSIDLPYILSAEAGIPFSNKFLTASRGRAPYTWSLEGNPAWIGIDPTTGELSGEARWDEVDGDYAFKAIVVDSRSPTPERATRTIAFTLFPCTTFTIISDAILPDATEGQPYEFGLEAINGIQGGDYGGIFELSGGAIPDGFSVEEWHLVTGVPSYSSAGNYTFTIRGMDYVGQTAYKTFSLTVVDATPLPLALALGTAVPPAVIRRDNLSFPFSVTGGYAPFQWSITNGPSWLHISENGGLYGRPEAADVAASPFSFRISVTDSDPSGSVTESLDASIEVVESYFIVTDRAIPDAIVGRSYRHWLSAFGGEGALTWSAISKPGWMTVSSDGLITGRPDGVNVGPAVLEVKAVDSSTPTALEAGMRFSFEVKSSAPALSIEIPDALVARATQDPQFRVRVVNASGALPSGSFIWSMDWEPGNTPSFGFYFGWLPNKSIYHSELTLGRGGHSIPVRATGAYNFTLRAEDTSGNVAERKAVLTVLPEGGPVVIKPEVFTPDAYEGEIYYAGFSLHGGDNDYVSFDATGLPQGLRFTTSNYQNTSLIAFASICGVPAAGSANLYNVSLVAIDSHGERCDLNHEILIGAGPPAGKVLPLGIGSGVRVSGLAIEPTGRYLFYGQGHGNGNLMRIDLTTGAWEPWMPNAICNMPEDIVFHSDGTMYVASDASAFRVAAGKQPPFSQTDIRRYTLENGWTLECALNAAGSTLYVSSYGILAQSRVDAINTATGQVVESYFTQGFFPITLGWNGGKLFAGEGYMLNLTANGGYEYLPAPISSFANGDLGATSTTVFDKVMGLTGAIAFDSKGNMLVIDSMQGKLHRVNVDPASGTVTQNSTSEVLFDLTSYADPLYGVFFDQEQNDIVLDRHDNIYLGTATGITKIIKP